MPARAVAVSLQIPDGLLSHATAPISKLDRGATGSPARGSPGLHIFWRPSPRPTPCGQVANSSAKYAGRILILPRSGREVLQSPCKLHIRPTGTAPFAMTIPNPDISAVIPNFRRPDLLRRCLESVAIAQEAAECGVEIVVVDDGSEDDSCEMVRQDFPGVRLVALPKNYGYPHAVNAGVAAARGTWILTLNNDTVVDSAVFDEVLAVAQSFSDAGSVAAQQRFASQPTVIYSAGMSVDRRGHASDRLMGHAIGESETEPVEVFGACGAAALYSSCMLKDLGGFDERFAFGLEDADVSWRARMRGWRCLYAPRAVVYHDLGATVPHGSDLRFFQAGRNRLLLLAKNLDTAQLIQCGPQIVLFDLLYLAYALTRMRTLAPLRGRVAGIRMWRTMRAAGAPGRVRVELAPAASFRSVLARRRSWRLASGDVVEAAADVAWQK